MANLASSALDSLKPIAGRAIEAVLNRLLALDPDTQQAVQALEGRSIQCAIDAPALTLAIAVVDGRFKVGPADPAVEPDLAVRGTLGGLLSQMPFLRPTATPGIGKVKISGDADLARQLQKLAERYDPDWNLPFTDVFGDVLGVQVASALRAAFRFGRAGAVRFAQQGAEFLTEESRDVVGRAELEAHLDDVDALRDRVDRLHARMQHLNARLGNATDGSPRSRSPS